MGDDHGEKDMKRIGLSVVKFAGLKSVRPIVSLTSYRTLMERLSITIQPSVR
jgi:hypothetical protein